MTLGGVRYQGRPLSAEALRRYESRVAADATATHDALFQMLRQVFPLSWRWLWHGDPVRRLVSHPACDALVRALIALPTKAVRPKAPDEWDKLAQQNADPVPPEKFDITLGTVCQLVECGMGPGWYYDPARWPTWDGYAPLDVVFAAWEGLARHRALTKLDLMHAILVTKSGDKAQAQFDAIRDEAFGG